MSNRLLPALGLALIIAACADGDARDASAALTWSRDTLIATPELLRDLADSSSHGEALERPLSVRVADASFRLIFISDVGADRVAVLDSAARVIRWIGTRGRGPGELSGASHLAIRGDRLFVGEALNGRVSEFTFDGRFVRAYASPFAAGALSATARHVFSAARSHAHYAALLADNTNATPAFARAWRAPSDARERWTVLPGHDLLAADSAHAWVFDQGTGELCRFDAPVEGRRVGRCRALPRTLLDRLRRYRDDRVARLEAATHLHVQAAPLAKDMVRAGGWIALLLPLPELPIVLVDFDDASLTPLMLSGDRRPAWTRAARSFAWDGRAFVLVSDDAIGRLHIASVPIHQ